jgi:hypothetical protein
LIVREQHFDEGYKIDSRDTVKKMEYDYIIIRSGFGGLVSALRLSKGIYCFSD